MKKVLLSILFFTISITVFAQDLPTNPEPGKCYVRCVTPDVWVNQDITVQVAPAYKKLRVVPAQYRTENEEVVIQSGGQELSVVPAQYETQTFEVVTQEASQRLDKDFIRPDAEIELRKVIAVMNMYPNMKIDVRSHTDSRANDAYNMDLSNRSKFYN